ncbi:hypothetical protein ON010_g3608 [Phytophthora cinnamomi]|nr:hypothetical protein ON010_g3608 [Phytophthora cinnamomi]
MLERLSLKGFVTRAPHHHVSTAGGRTTIASGGFTATPADSRPRPAEQSFKSEDSASRATEQPLLAAQVSRGHRWGHLSGGVTVVTTGGARIYDTGSTAETLTVKNSANPLGKAILYLDSTATGG